jgi:hypothetical protein
VSRPASLMWLLISIFAFALMQALMLIAVVTVTPQNHEFWFGMVMLSVSSWVVGSVSGSCIDNLVKER